MILDRKYYSRVSLIKAWWYRRSLRKLFDERVYKALRLHRTEWPIKIYFYSPRLKRVPRFIGDAKSLKNWSEASSLENVCPTNAIKVTEREIVISERGCIACGLCVEAAPEGLLEMPTEVPASSEEFPSASAPVKSSKPL